jgi:hypothetical protein
MRRCHLRARENILKRQLAHVGAFNQSLTLPPNERIRHTLGSRSAMDSLINKEEYAIGELRLSAKGSMDRPSLLTRPSQNQVFANWMALVTSPSH